ncbi:hypothetical protein [Novosphingobium sp. ST904]|uniref:hypothetical protein n=1 Tax=Novosphingobium sp. ST904 TaxID=1684385 RepID=UPI001E327A07|nr:hypothetical protein [Novosphingobium sp. ST904]
MGRRRQAAAFQWLPPGLDRKFAGCKLPAETHPPSHAWHDPGWFSRGYDDETRYRYADGYMLRIGTGNSVASYVPLLGGALAVGRNWPGTYKPVALPGYYTSYYGLGSEGSYRYYDNTIYRVKPENAAITGIAALLVGSRVQVGQAMPAGYDVYNVPYGYRDQYSDGTDALYRYSDGYIYQLDPATRLVRAAIETARLTGVTGGSTCARKVSESCCSPLRGSRLPPVRGRTAPGNRPARRPRRMARCRRQHRCPMRSTIRTACRPWPKRSRKPASKACSARRPATP